MIKIKGLEEKQSWFSPKSESSSTNTGSYISYRATNSLLLLNSHIFQT